MQQSQLFSEKYDGVDGRQRIFHSTAEDGVGVAASVGVKLQTLEQCQVQWLPVKL